MTRFKVPQNADDETRKVVTQPVVSTEWPAMTRPPAELHVPRITVAYVFPGDMGQLFPAEYKMLRPPVASAYCSVAFVFAALPQLIVHEPGEKPEPDDVASPFVHATPGNVEQNENVC